MATGAAPAVAVKEGDTKAIIWRTYLLYPATNVRIGETMPKVDEFLTTETGFELGAILEVELQFDTPFERKMEVEVGDYVIRYLGKILESAIGLNPHVLDEPIERWTKYWKVSPDNNKNRDQ